MAHLNLTVVDTDITVMWTWSYDGGVLETRATTSPSPHQITITFRPLTTDSSGRYYLNVTVMSARLPEYIRENSDGGTLYDLDVERKLDSYI